MYSNRKQVNWLPRDRWEMVGTGRNKKEQQERIKKWCEETSDAKGYIYNLICGDGVIDTQIC